MSKRIRVRTRVQSVPYFDISPSKKRSVHRRRLSSLKAVDSLRSRSRSRSIQHQDSRSGIHVDEDGALLPQPGTSEEHEADSDPVCYDFSIDDTPPISYSDRQQSLAEEWAKIREGILCASIEMLGLTSTEAKCVACDSMAIAVCLDCGSKAFFCESHLNAFHSGKINTFHTPQTYKNGLLQPYQFQQRHCLELSHSCSGFHTKDVVCIDSRGFQHLVSVQFCTCESEAATLVRHSLWPASPKSPVLAFHFDLLLMLDSLVLEGCIGIDAFCRALDHRRGKTISQQHRKIYPIMIDAFEEFKFHCYKMESLGFISSDLDRTAICPACPKDGPKIVSVDAVFGLCRKKSSGVSVRPPLFGDLFFEPQNIVDEFVAKYDSASRVVDKGCHEFLAGDALRSKSRYAALDETAVFGSVCRHQFPQRFFSMRHGERLAYPVYLLQRLKQMCGDHHLHFLYDVGCLFETHLKNRGRTEMLHNTTIGIPVFHVYGHCAFCQLTYSPRALSDCGLTDGEAMERLWSYLRRFAKCTKEMRPSHRVDVLTCALSYYAFKVKLNLDTSLCKKLKHAQEVKTQAQKELHKLIAESNGAIDEASLADLENKQLSLFPKSDSSINYGQRHKALQNILYVARERKYLLCTKARYADGQSIATRLSKKISSSTTSLKRAIARFNGLPRDILEGTAYSLPQKLQWDTVVNLEGLSSLEISSYNTCTTVSISVEVWSKVIRESNMIKRACEEESMIKRELATINENLVDEHSIVLKHIRELESKAQPSKYTLGCLSMLYKRLLVCEAALVNFSKNVGSHHDAQVPGLIVLKQDVESESNASEANDINIADDHEHSTSDMDSYSSCYSSDEYDSDNSMFDPAPILFNT